MSTTDAKKKVVHTLGISNLPEQFQNEIIAGLGETILTRISAAVFEKVPENAYAEFERISSSEDVAALSTFLSKYIPDMDAFVEKETKETVARYRTLMRAAA